ncbi:phosphoadenosine phosphosulfate reductase family protein [Flavobacterium rakeshii]|uniref:phosphoadenosine phosphosulfate reductase domain-containing protein n=1 Tax=Flavobacterium rakeshii TaxID=1038845 RepID=UPI002E7BC909|nr:phosphoadenosine phosphosulfate reductase family protein [Flavobacterium rakeshii]MEE1897098.1 phosphoadenosine phosphosulfate reductase family protein [Flavobacterium rakeshii]
MGVKVIVPFSGGKDSQATLLYAVEKYGADKITAVFNDLKWDHEITYNHIKYVTDKLGVKLVNLFSDKYDGFVDLCKKKTFPARTRRICTIHLKIEPMIDYVLSLKSNVIILQGIRADESEERSLMNEECRFFKYYFEPYQTNSMLVEKKSLIIKKYEAAKTLSAVQKKALKKAKEKIKELNERLAKGKEDEKYHDYRKEDVFEFCKIYSDDIHRPFFSKTANEVIYFSLNRGFTIHPFYFLGVSRIGCFPCIYATLDEMRLIVNEFPEIIDKIRLLEKEAEGSFFGPGYIPKRYQTGFDKKSGKKFPTIDDVVRYINDRQATGNLFENDPVITGCRSVYAICE